MSEYERLPESWVVWNDEPDKTVLAYRPDVFDSRDHPAECLPVVHLTRGRPSRRPGPGARPGTGDRWYVTLYLEPAVNRDPETYDERAAAVDGALELARAFDDGAIDYRGLYQVPREEYFDALDELTGREGEQQERPDA